MKKFIVLGLIISFCMALNAQDDGFNSSNSDKKNPKEQKKQNRQDKLERWSFGGNMWMSFGSSAYVEVSPIALYKITPRFRTGVGFTYMYDRFNIQYFDNNSDYVTQKISRNTYGPKVYADLVIFDGANSTSFNIGSIILASEYSYLISDRYDWDQQANRYSKIDPVNISSFLVGGGIYQPLSKRGGVSFIILWDIIEHEYSPYINPIIRMGFYF